MSTYLATRRGSALAAIAVLLTGACSSSRTSRQTPTKARHGTAETTTTRTHGLSPEARAVNTAYTRLFEIAGATPKEAACVATAYGTDPHGPDNATSVEEKKAVTCIGSKLAFGTLGLIFAHYVEAHPNQFHSGPMAELAAAERRCATLHTTKSPRYQVQLGGLHADGTTLCLVDVGPRWLCSSTRTGVSEGTWGTAQLYVTVATNGASSTGHTSAPPACAGHLVRTPLPPPPSSPDGH
jgi:hypothetical protein